MSPKNDGESHQASKILTSYLQICSSRVTRVRFSLLACAINIRGKGSEKGSGLEITVISVILTQ